MVEHLEPLNEPALTEAEQSQVAQITTAEASHPGKVVTNVDALIYAGFDNQAIAAAQQQVAKAHQDNEQ